VPLYDARRAHDSEPLMAKSVYERFGASALVGGSQSARRHTVIGGDTLPMIAARYYPDEGYSSEAWRQLAEHNDVDDLDDVDVGTVFTIPALQTPEE
jgi:nucleoid-associated protein YgaU